MRHGCSAAIFGRRADLSKSSAAALSKATGQRCLGLSGDVRKPETLKAAVEETLKEFGRIDYVIAGAAGNFLAQIEKASENAFKTVVEIDLVSPAVQGNPDGILRHNCSLARTTRSRLH